MKRIIALFLVMSACGKEEKRKDPPPPPPQPAPQPQPPSGGGGWPIPGFPSFPGMPEIPGFPSFPGFPGGGGNGPTKPADPTQPTQPTNPDKVAALVDEINRVRSERGLPTVVATAGLNCAAQRHANDVGTRGMCSHTGSDGSSPWDRAGGCGASADGEIIACGQGSPAEAVQAWTYSPGHAAIMYDRNQSEVGAAMVNNYWVVIFK